MKLKIIFMGTPDFAVPALEALAAAQEVVAVYCQAPKPAGRGLQLRPCAVQQAAERLGIPIFTPKSLKRDADAVAVFQSHHADLAVVAAYGLILPPAVLAAPRLGCVNIHASLLPRWRGAAPIQRALEAGDTETGVAIMRMEEGLDTGPVWRMATTPITDMTTLPQLHDTLSELGATTLLAALPDIVAGVAPTPQPEDGVTYAHKIERAEGAIDWSQEAATILRRLRAFTPWPGLFFPLRGETVKLLAAETADGAGTAGTLLDKSGIVACGNNSALRLLTIQRPSRAAQPAADALRGLQGLDTGEQLG